MKKRTILIASVLKPVDDTRAFGKLGVTLEKHGYEVHLVGRSGSAPTSPNITCHSLGSFSRMSWRRVFAPLQVLVKILQVKPEVLIVTTHELLIVAVINRIIFGRLFIYDIQENYAANIRFGDGFPTGLRGLIAGWVRLKERLAARLAAGFWLAEKCYLSELNFLPASRVWVVENKAKKPSQLPARKQMNPSTLSLLFTGTLSGSTGLWSALDLARSLRQVSPELTLHLAGYCARKSELDQLREELKRQDYITLEGGDTLVPHSRVLELIGQKDMGLVLNPVSTVNEHRIPTKLYEYVAYRLPILVMQHRPWVEFVHLHQAGVAIDLRYPDPEKLIAALIGQSFYGQEPTGVFWEEEEAKVIEALRRVLA